MEKECPKCGAPVYKLLYGEPMMDEDEYFKTYGEHVIFGGCCISDNDPTHACSHCGRMFNPNNASSFLPLLQPIADEYAIKNGWAFAQIYGKRESEYVFTPFLDSSEQSKTGLYFAIFIDSDSMTTRVEQNILLNELFDNCKKIRSRKGQRIFEKKKKEFEAGLLKGKEKSYWSDIISSVSIGYDFPIEKQVLYDYIDAAARLNLKLKIVPDRDFQKGGSREHQCDGWSYHIELKK